MPRHLRAFVRGQFVGRAEAEAAAVEIDHHRTLAGQAGRPDVQLEHVFAHVAVVPILDERLLDRREVMQALRAVGAVDQGGIFAVPRLGRFGRKPAVLAAGVLAVRYSLEREDAVIDEAAHLAILRVRDRRARRRAVSRRLVRGGLGAVGRVGGGGQRGSHARCGGKQQRLAAAELVAIFGI